MAEWHLDKKVSVGHLTSTVVLLVGIIVWTSNTEKLIALNAQAIAHISEEQKQDRERVESMRGEIRDDLNKFSDKLDRVLEALKR